MNLRQLTKRHGASNICRASGLDRSVISNILAGRRAMGLITARKIAKALGTQLAFNGEWIFKGRAKRHATSVSRPSARRFGARLQSR